MAPVRRRSGSVRRHRILCSLRRLRAARSIGGSAAKPIVAAAAGRIPLPPPRPGRPLTDPRGDQAMTHPQGLFADPLEVLDTVRQLAGHSSAEIRDELEALIRADLLGAWDGERERFTRARWAARALPRRAGRMWASSMGCRSPSPGTRRADHGPHGDRRPGAGRGRDHPAGAAARRPTGTRGASTRASTVACIRAEHCDRSLGPQRHPAGRAGVRRARDRTGRHRRVGRSLGLLAAAEGTAGPDPPRPGASGTCSAPRATPRPGPENRQLTPVSPAGAPS